MANKSSLRGEFHCREEAQTAQKSLREDNVVKDIFLDVEFRSTEVHQQAMFDAGGAKITKELSDVLLGDDTAAFSSTRS